MINQSIVNRFTSAYNQSVSLKGRGVDVREDRCQVSPFCLRWEHDENNRRVWRPELDCGKVPPVCQTGEQQQGEEEEKSDRQAINPPLTSPSYSNAMTSTAHDVIPRPKFLPSKVNGTHHKRLFTPNQEFPFSLRPSVILLQQTCLVPVVESPVCGWGCPSHVSAVWHQHNTANYTTDATQLHNGSCYVYHVTHRPTAQLCWVLVQR